jgi:hypothetical protein
MPFDLQDHQTLSRHVHTAARACSTPLRAYLSLHVGVDTASISRLWDKALDGIRHNSGLRRRLLEGLEPVWLTYCGDALSNNRLQGPGCARS